MMKYSSSFLTLIVHIGGYLDITQTDVHRQVVEVVVWHQNELLPQLQIVSFFISFIDEHSIEVFILQQKPTCSIQHKLGFEWFNTSANPLINISSYKSRTRSFYPLSDSLHTLNTGTSMKTDLSIHLKKIPYCFGSLAALKI